MTSLGVWKTTDPFTPGLRNPAIENGSLSETISSPKEGLAVTESGRSLRVQTEGPHLVSLGGGRLSTAITIHPVSAGRTYIGSEDASPLKDIIVQGGGIEKDHCFIENNNGLVTVYPQSGAVAIDGMRITEPTRLSQGCMLCLGRSNFFRFNHPKEAQLIKQIMPGSRSPFVPTGFIPVESLSKLQQASVDSRAHISSPYMESADFVEKVSKFEYLSHSQAPTLTSQDTPKWFVKEGIRIPHGTPQGRAPMGHSPLSDSNLKTPSPVSRFISPGPRSVKSGFSTPPPSPYHSSHNRVNMSPKSSRLYSKTPDPVLMGRKSPGNLWSGRCTPTSPLLPGCRSHHVSVENLKACEEELHEQHRKAVQERLKDEEQERQERLRLEEILHLCAEYEREAQREKQLKVISKANPPQASSSSSGEFSAASSESSAPESTNSSENSRETNSSKCDSNPEGYSSEDSRSNKNKYATLSVVQHIPSQSHMTTVGSVRSGSSPTYLHSGGYHTVPNRIKTNGSLPRDRGNIHLSPTSEQQRFGTFPADSIPGDGTTLFVNHKALNSASSEDELNAILGNSAMTKSSPTDEHGAGSPYMGTAFLTYPHSPRTRIRTVVSSRERGPEVYENRLAWSELAKRHESPLNVCGMDTFAVMTSDVGTELPEVREQANVNTGSVNKISLEYEEEIYKLQKAKQDCIQVINSIKQKVSELDAQKNEILNELELELALIVGELSEEEQQQTIEGNRIIELQNREISLEQKSEIAKHEIELGKEKIQQQEKKVKDLQKILSPPKEQNSQEESNVVMAEYEELKSQTELLDMERKGFEDLEFQQLESQAHREEEKEALGKEMERLKDTIAERRIKLNELAQQKQSLAGQMEKEKLNFEHQIKSISEQLHQEISRLQSVDDRLKELTSLKSTATPDTSQESSPRSSDSDLEVGGKIQRNGDWNRQPVVSSLDLEDNISPSRRMQSDGRGDNCNSFHSLESESSSVTSSDTGGERIQSKNKSLSILCIFGQEIQQIKLFTRMTKNDIRATSVFMLLVFCWKIS